MLVLISFLMDTYGCAVYDALISRPSKTPSCPAVFGRDLCPEFPLIALFRFAGPLLGELDSLWLGLSGATSTGALRSSQCTPSRLGLVATLRWMPSWRNAGAARRKESARPLGLRGQYSPCSRDLRCKRSFNFSSRSLTPYRQQLVHRSQLPHWSYRDLTEWLFTEMRLRASHTTVWRYLKQLRMRALKTHSEHCKTYRQRIARWQGIDVFGGPERFPIRLVKLKAHEILVWLSFQRSVGNSLTTGVHDDTFHFNPYRFIDRRDRIPGLHSAAVSTDPQYPVSDH
jgi:hypothetical protein